MSSRRGLFTDDSGLPPLTQRKKPPEGELDITPMIDVTFLLLIFFMVASTMQSEPDLDVPVARYGIGVETKKALIVVVKASDDAGRGSPVLLIDGRRTTLDGIRQQVSDRMLKNQRQVIIKAERHVPHGFVQELTRVVTETPGVQFYIGVHEE